MGFDSFQTLSIIKVSEIFHEYNIGSMLDLSCCHLAGLFKLLMLLLSTCVLCKLHLNLDKVMAKQLGKQSSKGLHSLECASQRNMLLSY